MRTARWKFLSIAVTLAGLSSTPFAGAQADPVPADNVDTLPGFKTEIVLRADAKAGSWICLGKDDKGRLLLGGQNRQPFTRVTLENGKVTKSEILNLPVTEAMGILYAFDSLYVDGSKDGKFGLYRLRDTKGDGSYDSVELLQEWEGGGGEHGSHAIKLGPDKKLYVVAGNFTRLPKELDDSSPVRNYADDVVLPRSEDGNGFGAGNKPPGGHVIRMDPDGKHATLVAAGERNDYDISFNADGELFGFDSDMEWDWGTPWYRPIRFFHAPSGADQGFREGSAKWPEYYPDSLPACAIVGIGSPTGVTFGTGTKFPAKYQKALFANDWTYGRVIAVHLTPHGSTYTGTWENLVSAKGLHGNGRKENLNLTGLIVGDDGALYFATGGRGTEARLYRVTYTGNESTAPADLHDADGAEARALRHKLESFHEHADPQALAAAWPHLGDEDRFIRYAARLAVERQPVDEWKAKALEEKQSEAALNALLALARYGGKESENDLLTALARFPFSSLTENQQLEKLRVIEVAVARDGKPGDEQTSKLIAELDPALPASKVEINRELSKTLLALGAHDAVAKTLALLDAAPTQEEQVGYVESLRTIRNGWTPELRRQYFAWWTKDHSKASHPEYVLKWFEDAGRPYGDGASYNNFVRNFHNDAESTLSADEKRALAPVLDAYTPPGARPHQVKVRPFVKEWTMNDLEPGLDQVGHGRDFKQSKEVFESLQCLSCHKFGNQGGAIGPDLTAISSRFSRKDILGKILQPSKVISEQYQNTAIKLNSGESVVGRVIEDTNDALVLRPSPFTDERVEVKKTDIKWRGPSKVSPMPEGLINNLKQEEIYDLLAYLESGGRQDHPDFAK